MSPKGTPVLVDPSVDPFELCLFFCSAAIPTGTLGKRRKLGWAECTGFPRPWGMQDEASASVLQAACPRRHCSCSWKGMGSAEMVGSGRKKGKPRPAQCSALSKVFSHQVAMTVLGVMTARWREGLRPSVCPWLDRCFDLSLPQLCPVPHFSPRATSGTPYEFCLPTPPHP